MKIDSSSFPALTCRDGRPLLWNISTNSDAAFANFGSPNLIVMPGSCGGLTTPSKERELIRPDSKGTICCARAAEAGSWYCETLRGNFGAFERRPPSNAVLDSERVIGCGAKFTVPWFTPVNPPLWLVLDILILWVGSFMGFCCSGALAFSGAFLMWETSL